MQESYLLPGSGSMEFFYATFDSSSFSILPTAVLVPSCFSLLLQTQTKAFNLMMMMKVYLVAWFLMDFWKVDDLVRYWSIISDGAWFKGYFWLIMNALKICEWTDDEKLSDFQNSKNSLNDSILPLSSKISSSFEWWKWNPFIDEWKETNTEMLTQTALSHLHTWTSYARRNFKLKQ